MFAVYVKLKHSCISNTVEPRYNEPLYNEVLGIKANDSLYLSNCKIYGRELRYSEQIWPFPGLSLYRGSSVSFNGYSPCLVADYSSEFHPQDSVDGTKPDERRGETKLQETGRKHGELCIFIWPHSSSPSAYQAVFLSNSIRGIP